MIIFPFLYKMDRPIILLHGLGSTPITLLPLRLYLTYIGGYTNIHIPLYEIDNISYDEALDKLDKQLEQIIDKEKDEPIIIGQSMGGLMANNLHTKGWTIHKSITIGSPLHGARLLNDLESILPTIIRNRLYKSSYDYLKTKNRDEEPPHPYQTITMSWPFTNFDGCVYVDEAIIDENHNTHLKWADHRTIFMNPRLWHTVLSKISSSL